MLRSFSYAGYATLFAFAVHAPDDLEAFEEWADVWQHWTSDAFLGGYNTAMAGSGLLPPDYAFEPLLHAFLLDKAVYELTYELNNRPDWARIPLAGVRKLLASSRW